MLNFKENLKFLSDRFGALPIILLLLLISTSARAGVWVTLYSTSATSGNTTANYSFSTSNYSQVRMTYRVNLNGAFAGYTVVFLTGKWYARCNGVSINQGTSNSSNGGAPAPGNTVLTSDISAACGNKATATVQLQMKDWGTVVSIGELLVEGYKDAPVANVQGPVAAIQDTQTAEVSLNVVPDPQNAPVTVEVTNNPAGVLSWNGTKFRYTAPSCFSGTDTFDYKVKENVANQESLVRTITINVAYVDSPPSLNNISNQSMLWYEEKAVSLSGIAKGQCGGVITVSVTSGKTAVVLNPTVNYTNPNTTATLTLKAAKPVLKQIDSAVITVTVNDNRNNPISKTFNTSVQWVNLMRR